MRTACAPGPGLFRICNLFHGRSLQHAFHPVFARGGTPSSSLLPCGVHPNGSPVLSRKDLRTLRRISRHEDARIPQPVMAVAAGSPEWRLAVRQPRRPPGWRTEPLTVTAY